jgi:hypothetical protein
MTLLPPNNPEIELLLSCARTHLNPQTTERINALVQKNIDWEYLSKTALHHRVMPLLYRSLKSTCSNGVPNETMEKLRSQFLTNAARNLYLTHELLKILGLMEEEDILAVPFKGPVLATSIFGDITLRQFSDLDILIHPNHALKARNVLTANGYRPEIELDDKQFCIYLKSKNAATFICDEKKAFVDLHWGLKVRNAAFPVHPDHSDNHLNLVVMEGHKVHNLPPEDLLLYLCVHGALHCWDSLGWICCVAELIQSNPDLNYEQIIQMVKKVKCERIFSLGLFLAQDLLGAEPPIKINKYFKKDPNIESLAIEVYRNLFHNNDKSTNSKISNKFSSFHIKVRDHYSEKIRHIAQAAIRPTREDWRCFPLPASISFLLYLLRPIRLSLELLTVLFKKCFKKSIAQ